VSCLFLGMGWTMVGTAWIRVLVWLACNGFGLSLDLFCNTDVNYELFTVLEHDRATEQRLYIVVAQGSL